MRHYSIQTDADAGYWIVEHDGATLIWRERYETLSAATARMRALQEMDRKIEQDQRGSGKPGGDTRD